MKFCFLYLISLLMSSNSDLNTTIKTRNQIRQKLKGSLNAWKLDPKKLKITQRSDIADRTPVKGITEFAFDDAFKLGRKIGQGASGIVYTCYQKKDNKQYAVKISKGDQEMIRIAKKTFKFLKQLNHPSVIKVKCLFLHESYEKINLVMEYFPYPSLQSIIQKLSVEQKKNIITKILQVLIYLHQKGICHRDIKLENILYDQQSKMLKIIDFGICKKIRKNSRKQQMWTITGTLKYMAPQVLSGGNYNQKVDCWALGVLAYRIFYHRYPFQSEYKSEIIKQITNSQPIYEYRFELFDDFVKRLLTKNPSQRISAKQALQHPWIQGYQIEKPRLGSEDVIQVPQFEYRLRNYSCFQCESPDIKPSRQEVMNSLKEIDIYECKFLPKKIQNKNY